MAYGGDSAPGAGAPANAIFPANLPDIAAAPAATRAISDPDSVTISGPWTRVAGDFPEHSFALVDPDRCHAGGRPLGDVTTVISRRNPAPVRY